MADDNYNDEFMRERIKHLRERLDEFGDQRGMMGVDRCELRALLDMASRCVSEETVRRLANAQLAGDGRHWQWFYDSATSDLKEAAEAIARKG